MQKFKSFFEVFKVVTAVFISAAIIRYFLLQPFVVEGSSMEPNFHNGEYLFVEKISYRFKEPNRGDVVVMQYPRNTSVNYIKRIIGLPGETVVIKDGRVFINGTKLTESYLPTDEITLSLINKDEEYTVHVPSGKYFVMGDNRDASSDSRDGWLLDRSQIVGRSALVVLPAKDFKAIASPKY
ncbi:signal peptidase I [Candidatus Berkelbacteria bacterium]|nr:signal peptidase I [Candidatus Berkelbacteria bacterium]